MGIIGPMGAYGAANDTDLMRHLAAELRKAMDAKSTAQRDANGNRYVSVDYFMVWQTVELLERRLLLTDQQADYLDKVYVQLNRNQWPDQLEGKPEDFDSLPDYAEPPVRCKFDYTLDKMIAVLEIIGEERASRAWWLYGMQRHESAWLNWWWHEGGRARSFGELQMLKEYRAKRQSQAEMLDQHKGKRGRRKNDHNAGQPVVYASLAVGIVFQLLALLFLLLKL